MATPHVRRAPSARRLGIVVALVASLFLTLFARLYYVQLLDPSKPTQNAFRTHNGTIVVPAPRGLIVDARGRPLVENTTTQVVLADRDLLHAAADHGAAALRRLAALLGTSAATLTHEITPCSAKVAAPCWTGEPYAPVPVATAVPTRVVLAVNERRELFPGISVRAETLPTYPQGSLAAQLLGYTGQVTAQDVAANHALTDSDTIGLSGLEEQYDAALRGTDGAQQVALDPRGYTVSLGTAQAPVQGDTLVTSIDLGVQRLAEQSLARQIRDSRKAGKPATGGAVAVLDPNTGRLIAAATYPTYNPTVFVGGISDSAYAKLTAPSAGTPLISRAVDGAYAPGSTFKLITASSMVTHHELSTSRLYPCPGSVSIDGRAKTNFESEALGDLDLANALGYSCDTYFYVPAAAEYYSDQRRIAAGEAPHEYLQQMAAAYGVGSAPGIDLPAGEQASGSYADRASRLARWKANRASYCAAGRRGYPDVTDAADRLYLTKLAQENCTDGWRYRAGDNADMSIGQGETTMSPLQLAVAYSAMLNGGKIFAPTIGRAVVDANGKVLKTITPTVRRTVPVNQSLFNLVTKALSFKRGWAVSGAYAYIGSSIQDELGGKTGTAEVFGKKDTSWLVSWGPTTQQHDVTRAKFVMVGMIEQGGTGTYAAGPLLKRIWDGVLGVGSKPPVIPDSEPETTVPTVVRSGNR